MLKSIMLMDDPVQVHRGWWMFTNFPNRKKIRKIQNSLGTMALKLSESWSTKKRIFEMIYNSIAALAICLDFSKHSLLIKDTRGFIIASLVLCFLIPMVQEGQLWTLAIDHPSITFNMVWNEISHGRFLVRKRQKMQISKNCSFLKIHMHHTSHLCIWSRQCLSIFSTSNVEISDTMESEEKWEKGPYIKKPSAPDFKTYRPTNEPAENRAICLFKC